MSIHHHPQEALLTLFAAGTLDMGQHIAVATHLVACAECRLWINAVEHVGGAHLENLPPAAIRADAVSLIEARLREMDLIETRKVEPSKIHSEMPGLPDFLKRYVVSDWVWLAPSLSMRRVVLPNTGGTRVFFLKSAPGTKLLPHDHTGFEMTCVLSGSFRHDGERYGPGDFDFGDPGVTHHISIDNHKECISLVAMQGCLRLKGLVGMLVQRFISI